MQTATLPDNEAERLAALHQLEVLDTAAEAEFDALVKAASLVCGVPISLISLVDADRQWFKANVGLEGAMETPRDIAFCSHAILGDGLFEVPDATLDPRFHGNPLVQHDPAIRFYCGVPLMLRDGHCVGTLCVIDQAPGSLDDGQRAILRCLGIAAANALEGRQAAQELVATSRELERTGARLREANAELERANEDLAGFVRVASHDLKSPLRGIDLLATWIADDLGDDISAEAKGHIELMRGRIGRMVMLLDDLRAYSRVGREGEEPVRVDTRALVEGIFELAPLDGPIQLEAEANLPVIMTRRVPLEVAFRNLIDNAIKHNDKPEPHIRVSARPIDGGFEFSVTDNGPGIEARYQELAFGLFKTLAPRDDCEGSGLGLPLVRKAAELEGGTISLDSDGQSGCTFRLAWPATIAEPMHASAFGQ